MDLGLEVLTEAAVHPPPYGPYVHGVAYPIAVDVDGMLGAVSFATWDLYPGMLEAQWWCTVELFAHYDGEWGSCGGEHDNTTSPTPFQRPYAAASDPDNWVHWHTNGPVGIWEQEPRQRISFFGVAPMETERLVVRSKDGRERALRITAWNGAYVAVVAGDTATLTGYGANGRRLGAFDIPGDVAPDPDPDLGPGWRRIQVSTRDGSMSESILWTRDD